MPPGKGTAELKKNFRIVMTLVIPLALVVVSSCMLLLFSARAAKRTRELTYQILKAAGAEQRDLLNVKLEGDFSTLNALAGVAATSDEAHHDQMVGHMRAALVSSGFACFFVADLQGEGFTSEGESAYIGDRAYFQQTVSGVRSVAHVTDARFCFEDSSLLLAVPIGEAGNITGAVVGVLEEKGLMDLLNIESYGESKSFVCDAAGALITGGESEAAPDGAGMRGVFENGVFDQGYSAESTAADFASGAEGFVSYQIDGARWYLAYTPLGVNGWMICTAVPGASVDGTLRAERANGYLLIAVAMASAMMLILFVILLYARAGRQAQREQEQLRVAEEEYRLSAQQSGAMIVRYDLEADLLMPNETAVEQFRLPREETNFDYMFALDALVDEESHAEYQAFWTAIRAGDQSGNTEVYMKNAAGAMRWYAFSFTAIRSAQGKTVQAVVTIRDVTDQREKLMEYERWRRILSSLTGTSAGYIEFDLRTGEVERIEGEFVHDGETNAEALLQLFEQQGVAPGDRRRFRTFVSMERLRKLRREGTLQDESSVRTFDADGAMRECMIALRISDVPEGQDAKVIVAVTDPGDSRRGMERLSELAFRDGLSGLLNRTAARDAIEETLRTGESDTVALFMLDIDNFKLVNDLMGHRQGDRALVQISAALRGVFRTTDVVARIGGDEFFVFLRDASQPGLVEAKAAALREALSFTFSDGMRSVAVSASVGIVVARRECTTYDALYAGADRALYEAKNAGKNRYRVQYLTDEAPCDTFSPDSAAYSVQLYSLLKYTDGGVALLEAGEKVRMLFASAGGVRRDGGPVWDEDAIHPEDRDALIARIRDCAQNRVPFEAAYRFSLAGGGYGWRHIRAERITYDRSALPVAIAVITDITDLKRSSLGLESITPSAPPGIAIVRFGERLETTFCNDALLKLFGVSFDQYRLISHDCSALLLKEDLDGVRRAVARSMESGEPLETAFSTIDRYVRFTRRVLVRGVMIDVINGVPSFLLVLSEENAAEE